MTNYEKMRRDFEAFDARNPHVYTKLLFYALQLRDMGIQRCGIRLLWERMRWDLVIETADANSAFKLNDHYTYFYARKLLQQEPKLAGLFELRERADREDEEAA